MKRIITVFLCAILFFTYASVSTSALRVPPMDYLNTYEEYQKFINEADLPDNFVYYESLPIVGEFKELIVMYEYDKPKCWDNVQYYEYYFTSEDIWMNEQGLEMSFVIHSEVGYHDLYNRIDNLKYDDLLKAHGVGYDSFSYYEIGDAKYIYYDYGELWSIYWCDDVHSYELQFIIPYGVNYNEISYDPTSLIGRLLNKQTAPDAVDFLLSRNYTAKPEDITPPNTADFSSIFGFLSLVSAGFFTIFAVKKSKKKVINEN